MLIRPTGEASIEKPHWTDNCAQVLSKQCRRLDDQMQRIFPSNTGSYTQQLSGEDVVEKTNSTLWAHTIRNIESVSSARSFPVNLTRDSSALENCP